ncbi:hypothetical protein RRG08_010530 [Elysia crispata]|uniref:Uncharacterized protein n=1 Tax=Elysia crispata TaxID=231223 RepID=A0AAE1E2G4_9GAST|nr:hypothetical protein RRG08_010530 [Elysia crispata]
MLKSPITVVTKTTDIVSCFYWLSRGPTGVPLTNGRNLYIYLMLEIKEPGIQSRAKVMISRLLFESCPAPGIWSSSKQTELDNIGRQDLITGGPIPRLRGGRQGYYTGLLQASNRWLGAKPPVQSQEIECKSRCSMSDISF